MSQPIRTIEEFFAHALAIEREAARSYRKFQDHFQDHGDEVLAGLCGNLARLEQDHYELLLEKCRALSLPPISDDSYRWLESGPPESSQRELVYRVANARQLLEIALDAEHRARVFFEWIAKTSVDSGVRDLAQEMAREENEHVRWVVSALEYLPESALDWERYVKEGGGPALALGAERRLHRTPK